MTLVWAVRKNSSSARRLGSPVRASVLARSSDFVSDSRIRSSSRDFSAKRASSLAARVGFGEFVHQCLDQKLGIGARFAAAGDLTDGPDLRAVVGNGGCQKFAGGLHHRMQLLRHVVGDRIVHGLGPDIGCKQVAIGRGVEGPLVAKQNVDRAL